MRDIDWRWFRSHLLDEILPRWRDNACTASGLFLPHFDRQWQPTGDGTGTLVSQGRLLYNFAVGYRLTSDRRYLDAVVGGAQFLRNSFYDTEFGGFFYRCDTDGNAVEDFKDAYGHAFALFGLSHASQVPQDPLDVQASTLALQTLMDFVCPQTGGMTPRKSRDFSPLPAEQRGLNSQNPMMHTFEACLAFAADRSRATELACGIVDRLFRSAERPLSQGLPEFYTEEWKPLATDQGGRIDVGHQFEWAYLLSRATQAGCPNEYLAWANELLDYGMRVGYDPVDGGIFANASLEGEITDRNKGWWQQCEATRAMMHFAVEHGREELWEPLVKTIAYFKANLIDPEFGGWYGGPNLQKGSVWKVDYHVVGMCEEALRLAEGKGVV